MTPLYPESSTFRTGTGSIPLFSVLSRLINLASISRAISTSSLETVAPRSIRLSWSSCHLTKRELRGVCLAAISNASWMSSFVIVTSGSSSEGISGASGFSKYTLNFLLSSKIDSVFEMFAVEESLAGQKLEKAVWSRYLTRDHKNKGVWKWYTWPRSIFSFHAVEKGHVRGVLHLVLGKSRRFYTDKRKTRIWSLRILSEWIGLFTFSRQAERIFTGRWEEIRAIRRSLSNGNLLTDVLNSRMCHISLHCQLRINWIRKPTFLSGLTPLFSSITTGCEYNSRIRPRIDLNFGCVESIVVILSWKSERYGNGVALSCFSVSRGNLHSLGNKRGRFIGKGSLDGHKGQIVQDKFERCHDYPIVCNQPLESDLL